MSQDIRFCKAHNTSVNILRVPSGTATLLACEHTCQSGVFECTHKCVYAIGVQMGAMTGLQMSGTPLNNDGTIPISTVIRFGVSLGVSDYTSPTESQTPSKELEPKMEYFEVPEANPGGDGICSDNDCPCGFPGAKIPRGTGYMYISKTAVDFRKDARTVREADLKMQTMQKQINGVVMFDQNVVSPTLMCEQGARKRGLDLAVAAADAKYWWETGLVPLRETPLTKSTTPKVQQSVQPRISQPVSKPSEATISKKSPILAAVLSFFLFGGTGQIYLGQWKKGIALIFANVLLNIFLILMPVNIPIIGILGVGDAYGTAEKIKNGESVGDWQFSINWKAAVVALLIYGMREIFSLIIRNSAG